MKIIIVLSCEGVVKVNDEHTVQGLLLGRLTKALKIYLEDPKDTYVIVTGKSADGTQDSFHMKKYLMDQNIPDYKIIEEHRARNTIQNAMYSLQIIKDLEKEHFIINGNFSESYMRDYLDYDNSASQITTFKKIDQVTIVSSRFHIPRVMIIFGYFSKNMNMEHLSLKFVGTCKYHTYDEIKKRELNENKFMTSLFHNLTSFQNK